MKYNMTKFGTTRRVVFWTYLSAILIFCFSGGCNRGLDKTEMSDIDSGVPAFQVSAMHKVAEAGNYEYLSRQIDLLEDEDAGVRFYAIMSLKKLTGTDNGYNYRYDAGRRYEAVKTWRKWLADNYPVETSSEKE